MARNDTLLLTADTSSIMEPLSPASAALSPGRPRSCNGKRKSQHHQRKQEHKEQKQKVKKQRVWKSLSRVLRRPKSYSALREDDSLSPVALDFNGNCATDDIIDWRGLTITPSSHRHEDDCETIANANARSRTSAVGISDVPAAFMQQRACNSHPTAHAHAKHREAARVASIDSSDSSSSVSDASTAVDNKVAERRRSELKMKKLEMQIEFYSNMNRMRPRMERVMEKLETYLDSKLSQRPPSHDLRFLQSPV